MKTKERKSFEQSKLGLLTTERRNEEEPIHALVDLHPTPLEYQQGAGAGAGAAMNRRAPPPLDESEFPREEPPRPRGRKKVGPG